MSLDRLKQHIREIINIENDELDQITSAFKLVKYPPKKIILKKGQACDFIAFINRGCLVYYSKFDEKERVINFPRENWWIGDLDSFLSHSPSNIYLKTLEETELWTLDYNSFMNLIHIIQIIFVFTLSKHTVLICRLMKDLPKSPLFLPKTSTI